MLRAIKDATVERAFVNSGLVKRNSSRLGSYARQRRCSRYGADAVCGRKWPEAVVVSVSRMALLYITLLIAAPAYAANSPWFGTWSLRLSDISEKPETLIYSDAGDGAMRMVSVEDKSELVTHFDGKPAKDTGAGAAHHFALAITATSPTSYSWTGYRDGKLWIRGQNTLAPDGKSFTEVSWAIAKRDKTLTVIYDRR